MDILFILSHKPDNRYEKRFSAMNHYYSLGVLYWNKTTSSDKYKFKGVETHSVDIPANRTNPLKRIPESIKFIKKAIETVQRIHPKCLYVGNLDMLIIAYLYKRKFNNVNIIYEIADLHELTIDTQKGLIKKVISFVLKKIEYKITKSVNCLVLTSMKFYDIYYKNMFSKDQIVFMPNIPESDTFIGFTKENHKTFTVGFIGMIRFKDQLRMLIKAAKNVGLKVVFAGEDAENDDFEQECKQSPHCEFVGRFDYKNEIQKMYKKIDCVYAVYDTSYTDVRVALPNKLYESILCELPIIVSKKTYLSEIVEKIGVGVSVDFDDQKALENILKKLSTDSDYYNRLCNNCKSEKTNVQIKSYNDNLIAKLNSIMKIPKN